MCGIDFLPSLDRTIFILYSLLGYTLSYKILLYTFFLLLLLIYCFITLI
jgi:hypothetical protein